MSEVDEAAKPTAASVGALLRSRTVDDDGNKKGVFDEDTTPNAEGIQELLEQAEEELDGRLGDSIPERLHKPAKAVASLLAAMNVESTYFSEAIETGKSPYEAYERRVKEALGTPKSPGWLVVAVSDESTGGDGGPADDQGEPIFGGFEGYGDEPEWLYDPVREAWVMREPDPSAPEGAVIGEVLY